MSQCQFYTVPVSNQSIGSNLLVYQLALQWSCCMTKSSYDRVCLFRYLNIYTRILQCTGIMPPFFLGAFFYLLSVFLSKKENRQLEIQIPNLPLLHPLHHLSQGLGAMLLVLWNMLSHELGKVIDVLSFWSIRMMDYYVYRLLVQQSKFLSGDPY